MKFEKLG